MTVHLNISLETLIELVEQLPVEQQQMLVQRIQEQFRTIDQDIEEKMKRLRSLQFDVKVNQEPSPRREDWYDDNGR